MFEVLPASGALALDERSWSSRAVSAALHAALIGLALALTARGPSPAAPPLAAVPIYLPGPAPAPAVPPAPATPLPPAPVPIPVLQLPSTLPPPALPVPPAVSADPGLPPAPGMVITPPGATVGLPPAAPIEARAADVPPVLVDHPALRYPEVLRQAGIEARILVEAVLDSAGLVEPGSLRIVSGGHALFEAEARAVVRASRYRAGRYGGRAVRVRVLVPVTFALRR